MSRGSADWQRRRLNLGEVIHVRMRCTQCHSNRLVKKGFRVQVKKGKEYLTKKCIPCETKNALERWRKDHPGCVPTRLRNGIRKEQAVARKRGASYLESGVYNISLAYRAWVGDGRVKCTKQAGRSII